MVRESYHHKNLPEALLEASEALIETQGVAGFSMREAARQIGVDPAACYRHFRDRDAILEELARRGFGALSSAMIAELALVPEGSAAERVLALGRAYVEFAIARPSTFRVMFGPTGREARDTRHRGAHPEGHSPYQLLETNLSEWANQRQIEIVLDDAALMLWSAVHGFSSLVVDGAVRLEASGRGRVGLALVSALLSGIEQAAPKKQRAGLRGRRSKPAREK